MAGFVRRNRSVPNLVLFFCLTKPREGSDKYANMLEKFHFLMIMKREPLLPSNRK